MRKRERKREGKEGSVTIRIDLSFLSPKVKLFPRFHDHTGGIQDGGQGKGRKSFGRETARRRSWQDGRHGNRDVDSQTHHPFISEPAAAGLASFSRQNNRGFLKHSSSPPVSLPVPETPQTVQYQTCRPQSSEANRLLTFAQLIYNPSF